MPLSRPRVVLMGATHRGLGLAENPKPCASKQILKEEKDGARISIFISLG